MLIFQATWKIISYWLHWLHWLHWFFMLKIVSSLIAPTMLLLGTTFKIISLLTTLTSLIFKTTWKILMTDYTDYPVLQVAITYTGIFGKFSIVWHVFLATKVTSFHEFCYIINIELRSNSTEHYFFSWTINKINNLADIPKNLTNYLKKGHNATFVGLNYDLH